MSSRTSLIGRWIYYCAGHFFACVITGFWASPDGFITRRSGVRISPPQTNQTPDRDSKRPFFIVLDWEVLKLTGTAESTHSSESSDHSDPPAQMGLLTSTGRLIWRYRTSRSSFPHAYHLNALSKYCRKYLRRKQDNDQFLLLNIVGFQATYIDLSN